MTHTTKHTPGLWFTTSEMQGVGGVKVYGVETRDRCPIANCGTGKLGMENAHLIAAAPAMYEALKTLHGVLDQRMSDGRALNQHLSKELFECFYGPAIAARAAIAKAEGA